METGPRESSTRAITVEPGKPGGARLGDVPELDAREGSVLGEAVAVGEWFMCRNGQCTGRGTEEIHGSMSERWRIQLSEV